MADAVEDLIDFGGDVIGGVFDLGGDVLEFFVDDIIAPVGETVIDVIESALDDPIKTIAQITAVATGNAWALPLIEGADVAIDGGDLGDVLEATAKAYVVQQVATGVSKTVGSSVAEATDSKLAGQIIGRGAGAASTTIVTGQDPLKAFIAGGVSAAVPAVLGEIDGFDELPNSAQIVIEQAVTAQLTGKTPNIAAITAGVLVAQTTTDILKDYDPNGTKLDNAQRAIITDVISNTVSTAVAGGNVNGAIQRTLMDAGTKALGKVITNEFKEATKEVERKYNLAEGTAGAIDSIITRQQEVYDEHAPSINFYNDLITPISETIQNRDIAVGTYDRLKEQYDAAVARGDVNAANSYAESAKRILEVANGYTTEINTYYEQNKDKFDRLPEVVADIEKFNERIDSLQKSHDHVVDRYATQLKDFETAANKLGGETNNIAGGLRAEIAEITDADLNFKSGREIATDLYTLGNFDVNSSNFAGWADYFDRSIKEGWQDKAISSWKRLNPTPEGDKYNLYTDALVSFDLPTVYVTAGKGDWQYSIAENGLGIAWSEKEGIIELYDDKVDPTKPIKTYKGGWGENADPKITTSEGDAGWDKQVFDFVSSVIDKAKSTNNTALINTVANVTKAGGQILKSFNGLSVFAGAAPSNTNLGKFAEQLVKIGEAGNTEQYKAAIGAMNKTFADAKGFGGTLKAIYKNATNYPIEFIAEYIGVEGAQEIVPLLIGGAAGVATKGLALAKGLGQEVAERIATKTAISSAGASDIAESVGGSAGDAFEDAYKTARDQGKSEAEATDIALNIATRVGLVAGVTTGLSLKLGGNALEEAILGKKATGEFAAIVDELGSRLNQGVKITIKEGVTEAGEEAIVGAAKESLMYALDPTRDVAKNITLSAAMGGIAGGAIAGTAYGIYTTGDVVSNVLLSNPTVNNVITDSPNAAAADKALTDLGISDSKTKANLLNYKYDADYTSQAEAKAALPKVPGYTFTQAEVDQFVGSTKNADLTNAVEAYVDPRFVDRDEAEQFFKDLGYTPTDAEINARTGQKNESTVKQQIAAYVDPRFVDRDEVIAAAKAEGVVLTEDQIAKYVGQKDEKTTIAAARKEFDPLGTTFSEAKNFFTSTYKYTPTNEEVNQFIGNIPEATAKTNIGAYVDPRQVTRTEAERFFKDLGYKPTKEEVDQFIRQGPDINQERVQTELGEYVDPRFVDRDEAIAAAKLEGVNPTDEQLKNFLGQKNEAETLSTLRKEFNPLGTTREEAKSFFESEYNYTPTDAELDQFVKDNYAEDIAKTDIGTYVDPRQVTRTEAEQFFKDLGYTPTKEEIDQFIRQGPDINQERVQTELGEYVDPRMVSEEEVFKAFEELGFRDLRPEDALTLVGQYEEALLADRASGKLNEFQYNAIQGSINKLKEEITGVSADIQTKYDALTAEQKALANQLTQQGVDLNTAIDTVKSDLQTKYDALTTEQQNLANQLTQQGVDLNTAIETAKAETSAEIQTVADLVGKPYRDVTQADIDFVQNLVAQQQTEPTTQLTPEQLAYDTNKDGVIDNTDLAFLQNVVRGTVEQPFIPPPESIWAQQPTGIYGTLYEQEQAAIARDAAQKAEAARLAKITQQKGNVGTLLQMLGQAPDVGGQQVTVKAPDPLQLGYVYDISGPSIFATPQQQQMFVTPYTPFAQGGAVEDDVTDALLKILRG